MRDSSFGCHRVSDSYFTLRVRSSWTAADWNNPFHGGLNGAGPTSARQIKSGLGHTFFFSRL